MIKSIPFILMGFCLIGCKGSSSDYWVCNGYSKNAYDDAYYLERHVIDFRSGEIKVWSDWYDFWNNSQDECASSLLYGEKLNECILQKRGYFVKYSDDYDLKEVSKVSESTVYIRFNIVNSEGETRLGVLELDKENKLKATYTDNKQQEGPKDYGRWDTDNSCSKNIPITWEG